MLADTRVVCEAPAAQVNQRQNFFITPGSRVEPPGGKTDIFSPNGSLMYTFGLKKEISNVSFYLI